MSATINVQENLSASDDILYTKYFELCFYENWSLHHYVSLIIDNYKFAERDKAHLLFFNTLHHINNNSCMSQEIRDAVQKLIKNKKVGIINMINKIRWGFTTRYLYLLNTSSKNYASTKMDAFVGFVW